MRRLLTLFFLVLAGCGSGGGNTGADVSVSDLPVKVQQDLVCYLQETDPTTGNTVYVEGTPAAKEFSFTLSYSSLCSTTFVPQNQSLIFEGCSVSVTPVSKLPDELKSPDFLKDMASMITCTADDIPPGGAAVGRVALTSTLVDMMKAEYLKYSNYAPFLYRISVTFRFSSTCSDGTVERTVSVPVEFSNFVENQNDLCQQ